MTFIFSSDLAFRLATPSSFRKGEGYFENGAVGEIQKNGFTYTATVRGTRGYTVSLTVADEHDVQAQCDCLYEGEGVCKHAVAVIFALARHPAWAVTDVPDRKGDREREADALLKQAHETQLRKFLRKLLVADEKMVHDFSIFLQGPKETRATTQSYKERITEQLDDLDLDDLEQAWLSSGEDSFDYYYPGYRDESGYDDQTLATILDPFREEAQKYAESENFAESGKIYQAIVEALRDKTHEVKEEHSDLDDWFFEEITKTLDAYATVVGMTDEAGIKKAGLEYFCMLFEHPDSVWIKGNIEKELRVAVTKKSDAEICLGVLAGTQRKKELSLPESSLLAYLYLMDGDEGAFEKVSLENLVKNPGLTLDLLKLYERHRRKNDIVTVADQVLRRLFEKAESFTTSSPRKTLEIEIREFLKKVFDLKTEYSQAISNMEALFLVSKKLSDYQELAQLYRESSEKEIFLTRMKAVFTKQHEVESMFKVFEAEGKKREILGLIEKYKESSCFPDMVDVVSDAYPKECFANYKEKIEPLLKEANVRIYPEVAYHLKRMRRIGLENDFSKFLGGIVTLYTRRRRLIEELQKTGLI